MKDELKRIALANGERWRVLAARVAVLSKLHRRDPVPTRFAITSFLLPEMGHLGIYPADDFPLAVK